MTRETSEGIFKCLVLFILAMYVLAFADIAVNAKTCECGNKYCVYNAKTDSIARKRIARGINKYLRKGKYRNYRIRFVTSDKLTTKMLEARKRKHIIYVEVTTGYVMSSEFDGITSNGYYIRYSNVDDRLKKGNKIKSYFIYNPANDYYDDIIIRTDRVVNRNCYLKNKKVIRKAMKKYKNNFGEEYGGWIFSYGGNWY